jgi:hypothetical protein
MCKIILLTGSIVGYSYCMEFFVATEQIHLSALFFEPLFWAVVVGRLVDVYLQRHHSAALLGTRLSEEWLDRLFCVLVRDRGDVVRALRDHCHVTASRLFALELGHVLSDLGRYVHFRGRLWHFSDPVSAFHQIFANGGHVGGEKCPSRG